EHPRVLVTEVVDSDIRPPDGAAQALHGGEDLFVDAVLPANLWMPGEKPGAVEHGPHTGARISQADALHDVGADGRTQSIEQGPQLFAVVRAETIVRVQP